MITVTAKNGQLRTINAKKKTIETTVGTDSYAWAEQAARNSTQTGRVKHETTLIISSASGSSTQYFFEEVD